MLLAGSISLGIFGCSDDAPPTPDANENLEDASPVKPVIDLSKVFELRIEGKTDEAIDLLRTLNEQYPTSVEVMIQLARSLLDAKQFSLAAFRFEQALSLKSDAQLSKEAAEAHYLAQDFDSAIERYRPYLATSPEDPSSQLRFARLLAEKGKDTEAINAFSKESQNATSDDCLIMGNLFLRKNLLPQAKHWYTESSSRSDAPPLQPLLGLLRVAKQQKNEREAETTILALEKIKPGQLESTDLAEYSADLLKRRRLADFIAGGMDVRGKTITQLASALLLERKTGFTRNNPVLGASKLPPSRESTLFPTNAVEDKKELPSPERISDEKEASTPANRMSLADAFSAPIGEIENASGASDSPLDLGQQAYLDGSYTSALLHARDALKEDPKDAFAWRLCSQAHFQLGETDQAEMTILEAIRHRPLELDMRLDYLRIARETLPSKRYLQELEKVRDIFPDSTEILWELARRYHIVESMPVTAAVLYRKIVQISPENSAIAEQAQMELVKLKMNTP